GRFEVRRGGGVGHLHADHFVEVPDGARPVVVVERVGALFVKVLFFFGFRFLIFVAGEDDDRGAGAERRGAHQQRGGEDEARANVHRESVPFVCALTTRTLNSRPLSSMRFCSAATSAGVRLWPACASSSSTGSRSDSSDAIRVSPRCCAVSR